MSDTHATRATHATHATPATRANDADGAGGGPPEDATHATPATHATHATHATGETVAGWVTLAEAVDRSGASLRTLQRAIGRDEIPRRMAGRVAYVDPDAIDAWAAARNVGNPATRATRAIPATRATRATRANGTDGGDGAVPTPATHATSATRATNATRDRGADADATQLAAAIDRAQRAEREADRWARESERLGTMLEDAIALARREQERADTLASYLGGLAGQLPVPVAAILEAETHPAAAVDRDGLDVDRPEPVATMPSESAPIAPDAAVTHTEPRSAEEPPRVGVQSSQGASQRPWWKFWSD